MNSFGRGDELDLDRDLPTSADDIAALRRNRPAPMSYAEYVAFLSRLPAPSYEELRARPVTTGEPFRLP